MSRSVRDDVEPLRAPTSRAQRAKTEQEMADLVTAIHSRRIIMCRRVDKRHVEGGGCPACGL